MFQLTVYARRTLNAVPPDARHPLTTSRPATEDRRPDGSPFRAVRSAPRTVLPGPAIPRPTAASPVPELP
jgi:hypothetical protein